MKTYVVGAQGNHFNETKQVLKLRECENITTLTLKRRKQKKTNTCFGCSGGPTLLAYMLWMDDKMLPICLIEN